LSTRALIALGANLGRRTEALSSALRALDREDGVRVVRVSPFVETDPVGGPPGQPRFVNAVAELETVLDARALLELLLAIEAEHGRQRESGERDAPRTLDLDLLVFGDERVDEPGLVVPHPRMEERLFVLEPLAAIAPELVLVRTGRTVAERVRELRAGAPR
jgi:2-amino-4-hydroxy-6-hydroxymethyldihydropteridine diphosphokinase